MYEWWIGQHFVVVWLFELCAAVIWQEWAMHIESEDWSASARRLKIEVLARATWSATWSATWNVDFHNYSKFTDVPERSITFWIYLFFIVPLVSIICISRLHWLVYFSFHSETECFFLVGACNTVPHSLVSFLLLHVSRQSFQSFLHILFLSVLLWIFPFPFYLFCLRVSYIWLDWTRTLHLLA